VFLIIGLVVVFGSIVGGYVMHHGQLAVLIQVNELLIIGGAGLGSMIVGNDPGTLKRSFSMTMGLLKPDPFNSSAYNELLQVLYQILRTARKDGLVGLEAHIENPSSSEIFRKYPKFMHHKQAVELLCDTLKVLLSGTVEDHHLADILDMDLEQQHNESMAVSSAITKTGDAMPGFGIVAAVLGVIITMGSIGGAASEIGEKVAAALVGTFLGILLSYGVLGPIAQSIEARIKSEHAYMLCIRTAILAFARGDSPASAVEFARRNIEPAARPSFAQLEGLTRGAAA
jgi:chemotaxis protein MotA